MESRERETRLENRMKIRGRYMGAGPEMRAEAGGHCAHRGSHTARKPERGIWRLGDNSNGDPREDGQQVGTVS